MKKVKLRGKRKGIADRMPKTLEYGVWYEFVTPWDWQYFKIKKRSKFVNVYDFISDKKPCITVTKKRFLNETIWFVKSPPRPVNLKEKKM